MLYMRCLPRSRGVPNLFSLLLVGKYGLTWANLSSYPPSSVDLPGSNRHLWILWHVKLASIIPSRPQSLCFNEELAGFQPPAAAWVGGLLLILSKIWAPVHLKCPRKLFRLDNHHSNLGKRAWKWCVSRRTQPNIKLSTTWWAWYHFLLSLVHLHVSSHPQICSVLIKIPVNSRYYTPDKGKITMNYHSWLLSMPYASFIAQISKQLAQRTNEATNQWSTKVYT